MIGEDEASRFQIFVTSKEDGVEHRLVKKKIPHPF